MPPIAAGRITPRTVRQRCTPSASAASRMLPGTSSSTSWLERAISGSITIASAIEPANPVCMCAGITISPYTNSPTTIVGRPAITSSAVFSMLPERDCAPANSVR